MEGIEAEAEEGAGAAATTTTRVDSSGAVPVEAAAVDSVAVVSIRQSREFISNWHMYQCLFICPALWLSLYFSVCLYVCLWL